MMQTITAADAKAGQTIRFEKNGETVTAEVVSSRFIGNQLALGVTCDKENIRKLTGDQRSTPTGGDWYEHFDASTPMMLVDGPDTDPAMPTNSVMSAHTAPASQQDQINAINENLKPREFYLSDDVLEDLADEVDCWNWDGVSIQGILDFAHNNGVTAEFLIAEFIPDGWSETVPEDYLPLAQIGKSECLVVMAIDAEGIALTSHVIADSDGNEQQTYQVMSEDDALQKHAAIASAATKFRSPS